MVTSYKWNNEGSFVIKARKCIYIYIYIYIYILALYKLPQIAVRHEVI